MVTETATTRKLHHDLPVCSDALITIEYKYLQQIFVHVALLVCSNTFNDLFIQLKIDVRVPLSSYSTTILKYDSGKTKQKTRETQSL